MNTNKNKKENAEVNYALCFCVDGHYQYAADIDQYLNGETVTNIDEASAWIENEDEAHAALEEARTYIEDHELNGLTVTLEEWATPPKSGAVRTRQEYGL